MKGKGMKVEVEIEKGGKESEDGMGPIRDAVKSIMDDIDAGTFTDMSSAIDAAIERLSALKDETQTLGGLGSDEGMSIEGMEESEDEQY